MTVRQRVQESSIGVDEVGRGALAGPVVAAAVVLPHSHELTLKDSKKLSQKAREQLTKVIKNHAIDFQIKAVSVEKIDAINILQASLLAMQAAIESLSFSSPTIWIDGNQLPKLNPFKRASLGDFEMQAVIKGDSKYTEIQAAAILAKVHRDELMNQLSLIHPEYGFDQHKGYPTRAHLQAIEKYGPILGVHRFSFAPIKKRLGVIKTK